MFRVRLVLILLVVCASQASAAGVTPQARIEALISALSSGDKQTFEAAARANYAPALLARRTPAERGAFVERMSGDFGALQIIKLKIDGNRAHVEVKGAKGLMGVFEFTFDDTPELRIAAVSITADTGGGGDAVPRTPPPAVDGKMSAQAMGAALDDWIAPFVAHDDFDGVVLIAHDGKPFVTRVYGLADRARGVKANADTAFNIASIGKKVTQTAIARLIQDGRLSLTGTIGKLIPDYPSADARAATIDQLVNHRAGIADFFGPGFDAAMRSRAVSNHAYYLFVAPQKLRFAPGTRTQYCNGCYVVLGEIVERLSGMAFEDFVRTRIFEPAHMTRSGYFHSDKLPPNVALPYSRGRQPGGPLAGARGDHGIAGSGAGGLYATADDLLAFDNALRNHVLLGAAMTDWVVGSGTPGARNLSSMAIAGGAPGMNAVLRSDGRWTVIALANVDPPIPENLGMAIAEQLVR